MPFKAALKSLHRHQFFSLSAGVALSNLLSLLAIPFLTRLYSAESFGIFATFYAFTAILGTFGTLRLDQALPIVEDVTERRALAQLSVTTSAITACVFVLLWAVMPVSIVKAPTGPAFPLLTALALFLLATMNVEYALAVKGGHLRALSARYLAEKLTTLSVSIALYRNPQFGLILAQIAGSAVSLVVLAFGTRGMLFKTWSLSRAHSFDLLRKYRDFPLHSGLSSLFQILQMHTPALIFSAVYPLELVGFYNLAQRIVDAPNAIVGSSLGTVFYRRLLNARREDLGRIYLRTMLWTGSLLAVAVIPAVLFAEQIVAFAFGDHWRLSAVFLLLLLPAALFRMLYLVGQYCLTVLRRLDFGVTIQGSAYALSLFGIAIGYWHWNSMPVSVGLSSFVIAISLFAGLVSIHVQLKKFEVK